MTPPPSPIVPVAASLRVAAAALVVLIGASIALVVVPVVVPAVAPVVGRAVAASPAYMLAIVKVAGLGYLVKRVLEAHVYTLQWSSMLILLFLAEGTVRAMNDPRPQAGLGALEAVAATVFFVAVLRFLRPLKKASVAARTKR